MSSGSFEADLRATREANGLSLDDIQQQTRIPVDVLRRFENGELVGDPTFNPVYLKAFLQSYAKALSLSPSAVLKALNAHKSGSYAGSMHPDYDGTSSPVPAPRTPAKVEAEPSLPESPKALPPTEKTAAPPAVQALRGASSSEPSARKLPPTPRPAARVVRPNVPTAKRSFDKNWTTILGLFGAFVVVLALAFYFLIFRDDTPDPEVTEAVVDPSDVTVPDDSSSAGPTAPTAGPTLAFPVRVSLTAGGDGLQSFRVTEDGNGRRPYWIEVGQTEQFEADSLLILWGEDPSQDFSEATVEIQGLRFTPQSGKPLRIDRRSGQQVLDSLASATASVPTPAGAAPPAE